VSLCYTQPPFLRPTNTVNGQRVTSPWSLDEDEALLTGLQVFGRRNLSEIYKLIPERDVDSIGDRIRTLLRWKIKANPTDAAAKCLQLKPHDTELREEKRNLVRFEGD
jgi:hypothetical protein